MRTPVTIAVAIAALAGVAPANAAIVVSSSFDQVARVNTLGGTVFQIGGGAPGNQMFTSANFVGPFGPDTGVLVNLPGWDWVDFTGPMTDVGPTEPANFPFLLTNEPNDMTFTQPGPGGPDGTIGDSSIQFSPGDSVSLFWNVTQVGTAGPGADFFIVTDPNSGGMADFVFRLGGITVDSLLGVVVPGGGPSSGTGGILVNVGAAFDEVIITGLSGEVEIDALASVPTPGGLALAAPAFALLLRRRRQG